MHADASDIPVKAVREVFDHIRRQAVGVCATNYFGNALHGDSVSALIGGRSAIVLEHEEDFDRLYYLSAHTGELAGLLSLIGGPVVVDHLTREPDETLISLLRDAGFGLRAEYIRIGGVTPTVGMLPVESPAPIATLDDGIVIRARMPRDLDRFCDHFPTSERLALMIERRQVLVARWDGGAVAGYFIFDVSGARSHLNYWFTDPALGPGPSIDLLLRAYHEIRSRRVKYVHAWVDAQNAKVLAIHRHFGLVPDGTRDYIFQKGVVDAKYK
jgi:hypothetical protein